MPPSANSEGKVHGHPDDSPSATRLPYPRRPDIRSLLPVAGVAQDATGDWFGVLDVGAAQLRMNLHVSQADSGYSATLDVPEQDAAGIPLDPFAIEGGTVEFRFAPAGLKYAGAVDPGFTSITGTFSQGGQEFPLNFGRTQFAAPRGSGEWARERLTKTEVSIPMRDGVGLFTSFYVPKDTTRTYPILLRRTPYNIGAGW